MKTKQRQLESELHISSWIIIYKFILGLIELIIGLIIFIEGNKLYGLYQNLRAELLEDSHDTIANFLQLFFPYLLEHRGYVLLFLIVLGLTKVIGAIGFHYKKTWGLDLLIGLTFALLPFDLFALIERPTLVKLSYFIINILIALYLVNFRPHHYFYNLKSRLIK